MPPPSPSSQPPAAADAGTLRKHFTWSSMGSGQKNATKSPVFQPPKEVSRAQTGLAEYNSKSSLVKQTISAYGLPWAKLKKYLEKALDSQDIDYSNKHEDEMSAYKDRFVIYLARPLSDTEKKEIDGLREGHDAKVEIRDTDEFDD